MQRPVMDPTFVKDLPSKTRRRFPVWQWIKRAMRWTGHSLLSNPLAVKKPGEEEVKRTSLIKIGIRMAVFWIIFAPVATGLTSLVLVWRGTHPAPAPLVADPNSQGCYFEPVSFASADGTQLSGWLIPVIDAHRVLIDRDRLLRSRQPAIVLVHDYAQTPQQMLPLVKPLHDEGLVVFDVALRGAGASHSAAETFGINESKDVAAAVSLLRQFPFVDPARIAVVGIGTGANASLMAASRDSAISALVIANPVHTADDVITVRIAPHKASLRWMEPLCRRVFELLYSVDSKEIDYDRYASTMKSRPTLLFSGDSFVLHEGTSIDQVRVFCRRHLHTKDMPQLGSTR